MPRLAHPRPAIPSAAPALATVATIALTIVLGVPTDAAAYLDHGTGSCIIQALVAGLLAGVVFLREARSKLSARLRRRAGSLTPAARPKRGPAMTGSG